MSSACLSEQVWALDFEFIANPGDRPFPVCMVAHELGAGRRLRLWNDEFPARPPFELGPDVCFVAYLASAELGCFLELGWPLPERILDLYVEFRAETNGLPLPEGRSLLGALMHHHIPGITSDEKHAGRALVMRGGPWSSEERQAILDYCETDVSALGPLLERMAPRIAETPRKLGQALLRGRSMAAVARMERTGVPIDVERLELLRARWSSIKDGLIEEVDQDFGVYEGGSFRMGLFAAWLADRDISWPKTPKGRLRTDQDTFKDMARVHPELESLRQLRHSLAELRVEKLTVGIDGRNRTLLGPFGASTGRNTPSASKFIFGPSVWLRSLIRPPEGRSLAYVDGLLRRWRLPPGCRGMRT